MLLLTLINIGGIFVSAVLLSVIMLIGIPPLFLKFRSSETEHRISRQRNILIIGDGDSGRHIAEAAFRKNIQVRGFILNNKSANDRVSEYAKAIGTKVLGTTAQLEAIMSLYNIREVIIAEDNENLDFVFDTAERCRNAGASVRVSSKKLEIIEKKIKLKKYFEGYSIDLSLSPDNRISMILKRIIDLIVGSATSIVLLPLMLVIALLVKTTSPGAILFRQLRVGRNGKHFKMYKFRTMYSTGSEDERRKQMMIEFMKNNKSTGEDTKVIDESRVTRIGKILRKTSLDELPQLMNVLKGEMSLVGPRPCVPYEYENYESWQKRRVAVLPGCTGVWQVSGRSSVSFNDSVILDLYYVYNISVLLDIMLLIKTLPVMLFSKGGR